MRKKEKNVNSGNIKEEKKKKHIFRKILLGILILVLLVVGFFFIKKQLNDIEVKKISNRVSELAKERTDYVFIEINPSFVLTIKENKVNDVACLNDDCVNIYNELDVKNKSIGESIELIYDLVKNKGFDTSHGIKIKTTITLDIEDLDYISIEYIDENTKNDLLSNLKNNENIKDVNNDDYYTKLWSELKKDKDYDKYYTCSMDNKELECHIIVEPITPPKLKMSEPPKDISQYINTRDILSRIFKKFGIRTEKNDILGLDVYINNNCYSYSPNYEATSGEIINDVDMTTTKDYIMVLIKHDEYNNTELVYIKDINLLNITSSLNNSIKWSSGIEENQKKQQAIIDIMNGTCNYDYCKEMEKEQKELDEKMQLEQQQADEKRKKAEHDIANGTCDYDYCKEVLKEKQDFEKQKEQDLIQQGCYIDEEETHKTCSNGSCSVYICTYEWGENQQTIYYYK